MRRGFRHIRWTVVALGLAFAACGRDRTPPPSPPAPVTVVKAVRRDVPVQISAIGSVEPIRSVDVKSMVDGQLIGSLVKDGDDIAEGQLLFRIDPRPAEAALRQSEAVLVRDESARDQARAQLRRYAPVARKGYISKDQMEQYRTNAEMATATVKVDQANVAAAKVALGYTEIRSPIAGRAGRILVQAGNLVKANDTQPLLVINQIEPIYVGFSIPGDLLGRVLVAQRAHPLPARARIEGIESPLDGQVAFVDNAVDSGTGTIKLRAEFANAERELWPGQLVDVGLTIGRDAGAIVIPDHAVQHGPDGAYVFVVKADSHAQQRKVAIVRSSNGNTVIAAGLKAGETVVLDGQSRVEDGALVQVAEPAP